MEIREENSHGFCTRKTSEGFQVFVAGGCFYQKFEFVVYFLENHLHMLRLHKCV